jgi:hypothetical protein
LVFNGKKENDSSNISSVKVSYLASAKFHKNNFRSAVEQITKKLLLLTVCYCLCALASWLVASLCLVGCC